jgi:hypothetical protein
MIVRTIKVTRSRSVSLIFPAATSRSSALASELGNVFNPPFLDRHGAPFGPLVERHTSQGSSGGSLPRIAARTRKPLYG